eukprot:1157596-Pelagomonas_calceolata.AAC.14
MHLLSLASLRVLQWSHVLSKCLDVLYVPFTKSPPMSLPDRCISAMHLLSLPPTAIPQARFASPCFPGETLHVQIWRAKDVPASALTGSLQLQRFVFEVFVEREGQGRVVVVKNAAVELARGGWQCEQGCKGQGEAATNWVSRL